MPRTIWQGTPVSICVNKCYLEVVEESGVQLQIALADLAVPVNDDRLVHLEYAHQQAVQIPLQKGPHFSPC
jgi:hypothetical protein